MDKLNLIPDEHVEPHKIEPPHEVKNSKKFDQIADHMKEHGWKGRPILAYEDGSGAKFALTGSHRIAAAKKHGIDIPVIYTKDSTIEHEDDHGNYLTDVAGTGDDRVHDFLKHAGDKVAARLMKHEMDEN